MRPPCAPAHLLRIKTGPGSQDRTDGLSIIGRVLNQLSFSRWSPAQESNWLPRFTGAAHRQQCLRGSRSGASGANRTLVGRLPCDCSTIELHRLEPKGGFEPPSEHYESSVFPTKLLRPLSSKCLERVTGFEPVSGPWQGPILAARRYPPGASGENRTLLACLEGRNSANKSHSREIHILTIQLSKNTLRRQHVDG